MRGVFCLLALLLVSGCHSTRNKRVDVRDRAYNTNPCHQIPEANSATREKRTIHVPAQYKLSRRTGNISYTLDMESLRPITLDVGYKMAIGYHADMYAHWDDSTKWLRGFRILGDTLHAGGGNLYPALFGIPREGQKYIIETRITVFETDSPGCFFGHGGSGDSNVLWTDAIVSDSI